MPSHALVVAVSTYRHLADLPPTQDVQGMHGVLTDPKCCAYPPERVVVLEQEQATLANVVDALQQLGAHSSAGSRTFFYFSGHGGQDADGTSYLLPADARKGAYPTTAISAAQLSELLNRCHGEVTVVLDCCYSGAMVDGVSPRGTAGKPNKPGVDLASFGEPFRQDIQSQRRVVFAACRPDNLAFCSPSEPYGILTGHVLDGLRGKASTDGRDVTVDQLFNYVQRHVVASSSDMQQPTFIANIERFYALTRYPQPIAPSVVFEKEVFISYAREDAVVRKWVADTFQPELERRGCTIRTTGPGDRKIRGVEDAIRKSKYTVVLLTESYIRNALEEFNATMAILQAVYTQTPRFIPILREPCEIPLAIDMFVGFDMTDANRMEFSDSMERLVARLKKEPHERV